MGRFGSAGVVVLAFASCHPVASTSPSDASTPPPSSASGAASAPAEPPSVDAALAAPIASVPLEAPPFPPSSRCAPGCAGGQAAYQKLFNGSSRCMIVPKTFPDIVVAGRPAPGGGCALEGVIDACCLYTAAEIAPQEFYRWPTSNEAVRRAQAVAWVREIMLAFNTVLDGPTPPDFIGTRHAFSPPFGRGQPNGGEIVWVWIREAGGALPGVVYTKQEVQFAPDGKVTQVAVANEWIARSPAAK